MVGVSPLITSTDTHCARFLTKLQVENETCCFLHLIYALEEIFSQIQAPGQSGGGPFYNPNLTSSEEGTFPQR